MAKKQKTKKVEVEEPQVQEETVVIEQPKQREIKKPVDEWEIKDRTYYLKNNKCLQL